MAIPKLIRGHPGFQTGDQLDFVIESDGRATLRPATIDLVDLAGLLRKKDKKMNSFEEGQKWILNGATRYIRVMVGSILTSSGLIV